MIVLKRYVFLLVSLLIIFAFRPAFAQHIVEFEKATRYVELGPSVEYVCLDSDDDSIEKISQGDIRVDFQKSSGKVPSLGYTSQPCWFRVAVKNVSDAPQSMVLEVGYSLLDFVDVYDRPENHREGWRHRRGGDRLPFDVREQPVINPVFSLDLEPNQSHLIYVRIQTTTSVRLPLRLWVPREFHRQASSSEAILGGVAGCLVVMFLYNLFLFFFTRDRGYILYCLYVMGGFFFTTTYNGFAFKYFWPNTAIFNEIAIPLTIAWTGGCASAFTRNFLDTKVKHKFLDLLFRICLVASVSVVPILIFGGTTPAILASMIVIIYTANLCFFAGVISLKRGFRPARYFLAAWISLFFGAILTPAMLYGLIPEHTLTLHSVTLGICLEAVLISMALGDRIQILVKEKEEADQEAIRSQKLVASTSEEARRQVEERNVEIEALNEKLRHQVSVRSRQLFSALALSGRASTPHQPMSPGQTFHERYEVELLLGEGGMGIVYQARRLSDDRKVAIKAPKGIAGDTLARLAREAMVASQVHHPNVVSVLDVDITDEGVLYLVLERVGGPKLSERREHFGNTDWALPILYQIARGLESLHQLSIVHRDLKPSNVLLTEAGDNKYRVAKISDFGISYTSQIREIREISAQNISQNQESPSGSAEDKGNVSEGLPVLIERLKDLSPKSKKNSGGSTSSEGSSTTIVVKNLGNGEDLSAKPEGKANQITELSAGSKPAVPDESSGSLLKDYLTQTGLISGTPPYVAIENALGHQHITIRSDLFSFGVLAFEMISGKYPFSEPPLIALSAGRSVDPPAELSRLCPDFDPDLAKLIAQCLKGTPSQRPTATEVAEAFAEYLDQQGIEKDTVPVVKQSSDEIEKPKG